MSSFHKHWLKIYWVSDTMPNNTRMNETTELNSNSTQSNEQCRELEGKKSLLPLACSHSLKGHQCLSTSQVQ